MNRVRMFLGKEEKEEKQKSFFPPSHKQGHSCSVSLK